MHHGSYAKEAGGRRSVRRALQPPRGTGSPKRRRAWRPVRRAGRGTVATMRFEGQSSKRFARRGGADTVRARPRATNRRRLPAWSRKSAAVTTPYGSERALANRGAGWTWESGARSSKTGWIALRSDAGARAGVRRPVRRRAVVAGSRLNSACSECLVFHYSV